MLSSSSVLLAISLLSAGISQSAPVPYRRSVEALNEEATAEAHVRDETATRAFTAVPIKVRFAPHLILPDVPYWAVLLSVVCIADTTCYLDRGWTVSLCEPSRRRFQGELDSH